MDNASGKTYKSSAESNDMEKEIHEALNRSLKFIQSVREELTTLRESADDLLYQCILRLATLARLIEANICTAEQKSAQSEQLIRLYTSGALKLLAEEEDSTTTATEASTKRRIRSFNHAREALSLLVTASRQLNSHPGSIPARELQEQLKNEERILDTLEPDLTKRPEILEILHILSLLIHRCRCLLASKRFEKVSDLFALSIQIEETAKGVQIDSIDQIRVYKRRNNEIENKLSLLESKNKSFSLFAPRFQWISNRLRNLQDIESIQNRILAGLGVSLAISLLFFLVSTTVITLLGTFSSINKTNERLDRFNGYILLSREVEALLDTNNQLLDIKADLDSLAEPINGLVENIQDLEKTSSNSTDEIDGALQSDDRQEELFGQEKALERLNKIRNERLNAKAEKESEFTDAISKLTALQEEISNSSSAAEAGSEDNLNDQKEKTMAANQRSESTSPDTASNLAANTAIGDPWYVSLIDFLASPIQDQNFLKHSRRIALAAFAGALGSIMSILIRLDQIDEQSIKNPFMVGALKPFIGAVFGIVIFMVLSTNVIDLMPANFRLHDTPAAGNSPASAVSGTVITASDPLGELDSQELYKIFLVAFLAGFSERLANDTLRSVQKK
ncbi:MAG: hypothetical protein HQ527_00615 [Cyanobacteria bacterium]|nr:hypothetical protein [Cyanobacteria bacterium bin.51]